MNDLIKSVALRAVVLLLFVLVVFWYEAPMSPRVGLGSAQFALLAFWLVVQLPVLHAAFTKYQYPLPQIMHLISAVEISVLACVPSLELAVLSAYLFLMVWVVVALFEQENFQFLQNGAWSSIACVAQWAPVAACSAKLAPGDAGIFVCVALSCFHACAVRYACADCSARTCKLAMGAVARLLLAALLVACWLAPDAMPVQAKVLFLGLFAGFVAVTDIRAMQTAEDLFDEDRSLALAAADFGALRLVLLMATYAQPELDHFRFVCAALVCVSHVANSRADDGITDLLLCVETLAVVGVGLPNPAFAVTPVAWIALGRYDVFDDNLSQTISAVALIISIGALAYMCVATDGIQAVALLLCAACVFWRAMSRFGDTSKPSAAVCAVFALALIGALCTVQTRNTIYQLCIVCMMFATGATGCF